MVGFAQSNRLGDLELLDMRSHGTSALHANSRVIRTNQNVERVLAELRSGIQGGRYAPGQRLITSALATRLNTSLAPVREALHLLIGEGLVELQPNRGARVRTVSVRTLLECLQVVEEVGVLAFRLIAPKLADAGIRTPIERIFRTIPDRWAGRDRCALFAAIAASHEAVNEYCGNSYLNPIFNRIHVDCFYRQMGELLPDALLDRYVENYSRMGVLLISGQAAATESAWREHVLWITGLIR
ncbi:MAG: GntR family transcriptional regulator [Gammaproteobacteria bacterium]|nr:GntR family transcriptional regulator [Gammaproteobacteria bacterium]